MRVSLVGVASTFLCLACARGAPTFGSAEGASPGEPPAGTEVDAATREVDASTGDTGGPVQPTEAADASGAADGCEPAVCGNGENIGILIGTDVDSVEDRPGATKTLSTNGTGSGVIKFDVVDRFAFASFDFNNLVSANVRLTGDASASYELRVTGGKVTTTCGDPYEGHVATSDASGVAEVSTAFARFEGMPSSGAVVTEDYGEIAVEVLQTSGDCSASWSLVVTGNTCNSNCAWNTVVRCMDEREPKTCAEVTD